MQYAGCLLHFDTQHGSYQCIVDAANFRVALSDIHIWAVQLGEHDIIAHTLDFCDEALFAQNLYQIFEPLFQCAMWQRAVARSDICRQPVNHPCHLFRSQRCFKLVKQPLCQNVILVRKETLRSLRQ